MRSGGEGVIRAKVTEYSENLGACRVVHPEYGGCWIDLLIDRCFTDDPRSLIGKTYEWRHDVPLVLAAIDVREVKE